LENSAVMLQSRDGEKLALIGVEDMSKRRAKLEKALQGVDENAFRILASHNPKIVGRLRPEHRISLVISGHTHGGQIRLFSFGLYEKGGLKSVNGTAVYVSNGYGTTTIPLRLGAPAETNLITIRSWKEEDKEKMLV